MKCSHYNFHARVNVNRIAMKEGGPVVAFAADVTIKCVDCGVPFEFVGLPVGLSGYQATTGIDALEARMPIVPQGEKPYAGQPGFSVKFNETEQ